MKTKKLLSMFLTMCIMCTMLAGLTLPTAAATVAAATNSATSGTTGDCTWTLDGTTLTISGNGEMGDYVFQSLPYGTAVTSVIVKDGVTNIGPGAFAGCENLTSITIPDSVTEIDDYAFSGCSSLASIKLPNGVTYIGGYAFYGCNNLENINLPNSLTIIGSNAFGYCSNLSSITIPGSVEEVGWGAFIDCKNLESVVIEGGVKCLEENVFSGCSKLSNITLPDSLTRIRYNAFYDTAYYNDEANWQDGVLYVGNHLIKANSDFSTENYTVKDGTKVIADYAFYYRDKLISITLPDSVVSIGDSAFYECENLASINVPDNVTYIGWEAFYNCGSLTSINIPNGITSINNSTFRMCSSLKNITLPDSVTEIGGYAFNGCKSLTSINIPNGVTSIGYNAFYNCSSLTNITIPDSVTEIGDWAFYGCSSLTSINIPNGVTSINNYTFDGCSSLTSITIPDSVTSIGNYAFRGCSSLTSITIPDSVTSIGYYAFYNCSSLANITIGNGVTSIGREAFYNTAYLNDYLNNDDYYQDETTHDGIIYIGDYLIYRIDSEFCTYTIKSGTKLIADGAFYDCFYIGDMSIPDSVVSIGNSAFSYSDIRNITIPDSVTNIGESAFSDCESLTSVTIPEGVTSIEDSTFSWCANLANVTIPDSVTSIGNGAFSACDSLVNISIPNSVTSIGDYAFQNCDVLASITIPDSVISIGWDAFKYCIGLKSVTIGSGLEKIGSGAFSNCTSLTGIYVDVNNKNYCSDNGALFDKKKTTLICYPASKSGAYTIPSGVTSIGDSVFSGCKGLTSITIPDSVTSIGSSAFYNCSNLTSITIPDSVTSIGYYAFQNCSSLTSITIPDSVTNIGESAFRGCSSLTSITIPDGVEEIPEYAFCDCTSLTNVTIGNGVINIGECAFGNCSSLTNLVLPDGITSIGWRAFYNTVYDDADEDGVLYIGSYLVDTDDSFSAEEYTIKSGTKAILKYAFEDCNSLASITIPDSVKRIGNNAFYGTAYYNNADNWQDDVLYIGNYLINVKSSIEGSYKIKDGTKFITDGAFSWCGNITSIIIPNGVESIGVSAFDWCESLASITIPNSVTSIGGDAFFWCDNLEKVYYCGTNEEWNEISISEGNTDLTDATRYNHNYDNACDADCSLCGEKREAAHSYKATVTPPTCKENGYTTYTCTVCGDSYTADETEAGAHNYKSVVTKPTATAQGYTTYTCSACGDSYKNTYTDATGNIKGVKNLKITATDVSITVSWDAYKGATKYLVYLKDEYGKNLMTREQDASTTSYTFNWPDKLEWDKNYIIGVRGKAGSEWLTTINKDASLVVGSRVVDVKTESVGRTIKVNWRAYEGATQYRVYVYEKGAYPTAFTNVKTTTNSATIINAINPEVDYEVRVVATVNGVQMKTVDALAIDARLNIFNPDTFIERGITPTKVAVGWDEVRGADKYWVYLTPVGGGAEIIKESTKAIAAVAGLAPNTEYTVQIQARITDADGEKHYSGKSEVLGTISTNDWENINFKAVKSAGKAKLTWTPPTNVTQYFIYRSTDGGKTFKKIKTITNPTAVYYPDPSPKSGYIYAIVTQIQDDFVSAKSPLIKSAAI